MTHLTREQIAEKIDQMLDEYLKGKNHLTALSIRALQLIKEEVSKLKLASKERDQVVWESACKATKEQDIKYLAGNGLELAVGYLKIFIETPLFKMEGE